MKKKDLRTTKKFWEFYKSSVKIRSDKNRSHANLILEGDKQIIVPEDIATLFNNFFTSLESSSLAPNSDCDIFIKEHFSNLKNRKVFETSSSGFSFKDISISEVKKILKELPTSSPGTSGINSKILKLLPDIMAPVYTKLFNFCLATNSIPEDWKTAIVTPLYKNKGASTDLNNYRGISVLSPIAKVFEKILAFQISCYFEINNLFTPNQHGFRKVHSCESALHELLSDLNKARNDKLTTMLLFIDFKKAFDTVDSNLLLSKLFHYGFDTKALLLIADYFKNRQQLTKINNSTSEPNKVILGVPQGSILGPLFFLIYINDLIFYINDASAKLFADDTTIYYSDKDLGNITKKFSTIII